MRLDKFLSECGTGTRSEVKKQLKKGQIRVNGLLVKDGAHQVNEMDDLVLYNGTSLHYQAFRYYMLNKPAGCVSATQDSRNDTVLDFLKNENVKDLFPVGRLDKDTEGLLLLTNDGALAHQLLSPKKHVDKTYFVKSDRALSEEAMQVMARGVEIGDEKPTLPAWIEKHDDGYLLTIQEGRFHQVKRMFEACGAKVLYLKRLRMGSLQLDPSIKPGEYRALTAQEIHSLKA